jgi:hypothetical protein
MDIPQIRKLKPALKKFLKRFDHCFPRKDTRAHLPVSVVPRIEYRFVRSQVHIRHPFR